MATTRRTTAPASGGAELASPADPTPTPMVVDRPPGSPVHDGASDGGRTGVARRRRWPVVLLVVVATVAGIVVATRGSTRSDVQYVDWYTGELATAPAAPDGRLDPRWSHSLPRDREFVGVSVADRMLVAVTRPRLGSGADGAVVVTGHDLVDGRVAWRRSLDDARPAVVVGGDRPTLVANTGDDGGVADRFVWDRTSLVALDPADGTTRWRHDFPDGDGSVQVRPDGTVVTGDTSGVRELDPADGDELLDFPVVADGDAPRRFARRSADGWAVPDPSGWRIVDLDGRHEFAVTDVDGIPLVDADVAVVRTGSQLVALARPSGDEAWRVDLGGEVRWVEPVAATSPSPGGWLVGVRDDGAAVETMEAVLVRDGRVVDEPGPEGAALATTEGARMGLVLDGRRHLVCRRLRDDRADRTCPAALALLDAEGQVVGRRTSARTSDLDPSLTWQATDVGIVTIERGVVRLSRWSDLAPAWSITLQRPILRPVRVATSPTGVAIARNDVGPARVAWYG